MRKLGSRQRITLKRSLKNCFVAVDWIQVNRDRGPWFRSCKPGNEPSGCKKWNKFLHQLNNYQFLKKLSPWIYLYIRNPETCYINGIRQCWIIYDIVSTLLI